jgi:uracil phosphoribosyltransferase
MNSDLVTVFDHPLIQHKLTIMRKKDTSSMYFRKLLREISSFMIFEITRNLTLKNIKIETPLETTFGSIVAEESTLFVSILRAGNGILDGVLDVIQDAKIGHIGLYRDSKTLEAVEYYFKIPSEIENYDVILLDPMLATGNSADAAIKRIKLLKPRSIKFLCLLSCPEGIEHINSLHPEVPIYTASIDRKLNTEGYILPGLGDAGDRIFGTT